MGRRLGCEEVKGEGDWVAAWTGHMLESAVLNALYAIRCYLADMDSCDHHSPLSHSFPILYNTPLL